MYSLIDLYIYKISIPKFIFKMDQSALAIEYTDCFSDEKQSVYSIAKDACLYIKYIYSIAKDACIYPDACSGYDTKQSDAELPVMLKLWGMRSTPSLLSLPSPL